MILTLIAIILVLVIALAYMHFALKRAETMLDDFFKVVDKYLKDKNKNDSL